MNDHDIANMESQRLGDDYTLPVGDVGKAKLAPVRPHAFVFALSERLNPSSEYQRLLRERATATVALQESQRQFDSWRLKRDRYGAKVSALTERLKEILALEDADIRAVVKPPAPGDHAINNAAQAAMLVESDREAM